ncbi:MAG TPA: hypothetical protein VFZ25_02270 [Chloroflexota bacterium]|nr:hypothetical protein [Chloroflexota bacterium]
MARHEIALDGARGLEIVVQGDFVLAGNDQPNALLDDDSDEFAPLPLERRDDVIRIEVPGDGRLTVPRGLAVRIARVDGDLRAVDLGAELQVAQVNGDATFQHIDGPVICQAVMGDCRVREIEGEFTASRIAGDLDVDRVRGPVQLTESVDGDLDLADIADDVAVGAVHGDLTVQGCGALRAGSISGDGRVQNARGEVNLERLSGDAKIEDCQGPVEIEHVDGDLSAANVSAGLSVSNVAGDARLTTGFAPGATFKLRVHGSARLAVMGEPGQVSARFDLHTRSGRIANDLPLENADRTPNRLQGLLGDGSASVRIESDGPITLTGREGGFDWGSMGNVFGDFSKDFATAFGAFGGPEFEGRIREHAEKFGRQAEEVARKASERAQRHAERMAREAERQGQRWGTGPGNWWRPPTPPQPPSRPTPPRGPRAGSSEERMLILRMLSDGRITAEEAARLLDALG